MGAGGSSIPAALASAVGPIGHVLAADIGPSWLKSGDGYEVRQHDVAADPPPELLVRRGADLRYGRTLPRTLREAGLVDVAAAGFFPVGGMACNHLEASRGYWAERINEAEHSPPEALAASNGWVVAALQTAWSAISYTPVPEQEDLGERVVRLPAPGSGDRGRRAQRGDTDTVAAITGALAGARQGVSAIPADWRRRVFGYPDLRSRGLVRLAVLTARQGVPDGGWR